MGFLHPITDKVCISAHGCASHSWSRKIVQMQGERKASLPALMAVTKERLQYSPILDRKISAPSKISSSQGWMSAPISRVGSANGFSTLPRVGTEFGVLSGACL